MLSTGRTGRAVAVVAGGSHDGVIIRIAPESEAETPQRDIHEVLDEGDFRLNPEKFKLLGLEQRLKIYEKYIKNLEEDEEDDDETDGDESDEKQPPTAPQRRLIYRGHLPPDSVSKRVAAAYKDRSKYEYRLDCGKMVVLPSKDTERVFVAGKSGAGKSCFAASYIREYQEMFPDRKVFLFSVHDGEKAYAMLEHAAIVLDEGFLENPPGLDDLKNSLCVFDDCDALQNRKLMAAVDAVNLDLINNGRKYNITVLTLAHQLMEYKRTRGQLNEASRVVFFPQGSSYHNKRFLKEYGGLNSEWIKKILSERSRWVCLDTGLPNSYVTENAVVIIR